MKSFVITGATSMIGIGLCQYISSFDGYFVFAICRENSDGVIRIPINEHIKVIYTDLKNIGDIVNTIGKANVFIHLAWEGTTHNDRNNELIQESNVKYSLDAIFVSKLLGCKLFIDSGSQAEYGYVNDLITEKTPCHPENEYGKAKLKFGYLASKLCNELGIKYIHLRIMSIYGETDHLWTLVMASIRKMLSNEDIELSSCTQKWNFVYLNDAVKQIYLLCEYAIHNEKFKSEIYNIGSYDTRILKDFILEIYKLTNSKSKLLFGTYQPLNIVSLNPSVKKTSNATGGFIAEHTFEKVINKIINNFKNCVYEKGK